MSNTPAITYIPEKTTTTAAWYDSISGSYSKASNTSSADSMDPVSIPFLVPEGYEASLTASLGVDDWGTLQITNTQTGAKVLVLSLTSDDDAPGPNGGHTYWEKSGTVTLPAGTYTISISHQNITYPANKDPKYNATSCKFSITATKTHLPHTVSTSYTIQIESRTISLSCPVSIIADCHGLQDGGKIIENVRIASTGSRENVEVDFEGTIYRILLEDISVAFAGEMVNDVDQGVAARLVRVYWSVRIWDKFRGGEAATATGEFYSDDTGQANIHADPTLFCPFS